MGAVASTLSVVTVMGLTAGMAVAVTLPATSTIAAFFPPWWSPARTFQAAASAGEIVGVGRLSSLIVVRSDRGALAARLKAAGALATLASDGSGGCSPSGARPEGMNSQPR